MPRSLAEIQISFGAALLDPERPVPPDVVGRHGTVDTKRFAVYRNNVMVGLVDALQARFPVTFRLVGEQFFRAMARVFAGARQPRTPLLMHYGDDFPDFIAGFGPAASVPYLADVARLERAWSDAYHAPEASPLPVAALASQRPEGLARSRLRLHPSLRLLRSTYPIATIWSAHQTTGEIIPPQSWEAEDVLIVRPQAKVMVHRLPPDGYEFIAALAAGSSVEDTALTVPKRDDSFDVGRHLVGLASLGAVVAIDSLSENVPPQEVPT
jgi:hypothetical protein